MQHATQRDVRRACPICNGPLDHDCHVSIDCGQNVGAVVPEATMKTTLIEVPTGAEAHGTTRRYPAGTRRRLVVTPQAKRSDAGVQVLLMDEVEQPIPATRLVERTAFDVPCCMNCRADFIAWLEKWGNGGCIGAARPALPADTIRFGRNRDPVTD